QMYQCLSPGDNPYIGSSELSKFWKGVKSQSKDFWKAPDGLFWICGQRAYHTLPGDWEGSCTIGIICPGFFMLPEQDGAQLGVPL
ncbi:ENR1 protein, partial [Atrichornis clamosus]|nr:ENR1 protein [Atrichornis clamosus]